MKEQLVTRDVAKLAREKGFDWECWYFHEVDWTVSTVGRPVNSNSIHLDDKYFSLPTQSLLQKWLRDVHTITIVVSPFKMVSEYTTHDKNIYWDYVVYADIGNDDKVEHQFNSYEEALEQGLLDGLKLIP